jgi:hypothetical protein
MGMPFLKKCRLGVLQFVPVQIVCTTLCCVLTHYKVYQEGVWLNQKLGAVAFTSDGFLGYGQFTPFGFVNLLRILSCTIALYCLVYFYHGTRRLLADIDPLAKFLTIKMVVFATFYQRIVLTTGTNKSPFGKALNLKRWWMNIMLMHFNSYEYFANHSSHFDDGQTHHGCDCIGSQLYKDPADRRDTGFQYFNISWGARPLTDGPNDFSYCCNGILDSTDLDNDGFTNAFKDDLHGHATKQALPDFAKTNKKDLVCNFGMENQSQQHNGAYNSLWCPINISTCKKAGKASTAKANMEWITTHFLTTAQKSHLNITVDNESWWDGANFSESAAALYTFNKTWAVPSKPQKEIYWDFCDSRCLMKPIIPIVLPSCSHHVQSSFTPAPQKKCLSPLSEALIAVVSQLQRQAYYE